MKALAPYLWIGLGGFLGANARYLVSRLCADLFGVRFPWGTFVVNVSGSFVLGFLVTLISQRLVPHDDQLRLAIGVGFLGAYTTFSTFEFETHGLLGNGQWAFALANVIGSVIVGLLALRLGVIVARL
ncbi:MAG: fluoride efflux transporter CrcB [bacterium]